MVGAEIVEVATWDQLTAAVDDGVVMIALLGTKAAAEEFRIPRLADLARPRGIPIVVDAASEHLTRPEPYLAQGATMVAYSGGKFLRGPQCTGLLLGEEPWVRAAWLNSAPHHAFGRTMKVGKEEVIGLLAAVEHWAGGRDPAAERRQWARDLDEIAREVERVPSVATTVREPTGPAEPVPRLEIRWDPQRVAWTGLELRTRLAAGEPRIMLDDRGATATSVTILPNSLQPGEAKLVGIGLREALAAAPEDRRAPVPPGASPSIAGTWDVCLEFVHGTSCHEFVLDQRGAELTGAHRTPFFSNDLSGRLVGTAIVVRSLHPFEGTNLAYRFTGTVTGASMTGTVELGSSGESAPGPLNQREYGMARWQATRRG
jgi:D-glucosaminate-6-phosphate ammonia-lyase